MIELVGTCWLLCSILEHWQAIAMFALMAAALKAFRII